MFVPTQPRCTCPAVAHISFAASGSASCATRRHSHVTISQQALAGGTHQLCSHRLERQLACSSLLPQAAATALQAATAALRGFDSIDDALGALDAGHFVLVLDNEDRENEGDLIISGAKVTPQMMAFMVEHTTGIICAAMRGRDLDRLDLPLMVPTRENEEALTTAFTVSVDARLGTTTGVSASDRCMTIRTLADPCSTAASLRRPGHIFPLRVREGGVVFRPGHTEAAVQLLEMAGCSGTPVGVLSEVVDRRDGSMARTPYLLEFARQHNIKCITIASLVQHLSNGAHAHRNGHARAGLDPVQSHSLNGAGSLRLELPVS